MVQEFYYHLVTFVTDAYLLLKGSVPVFCIVFITVGNSLIINFVPPKKKEWVMRSTFKVLFYVKKGSEKPNGNLPLMCRITVDGTRLVLAIDRKPIAEWFKE